MVTRTLISSIKGKQLGNTTIELSLFKMSMVYGLLLKINWEICSIIIFIPFSIVKTSKLTIIPIQSISPSLKDILDFPFADDEIRHAVWKFGPWKAPGSDGIHIGFYKENWELVGPLIIQIAHKILLGSQ